MKLLLDECIDRRLAAALAWYEVKTVSDASFKILNTLAPLRSNELLGCVHSKRESGRFQIEFLEDDVNHRHDVFVPIALWLRGHMVHVCSINVV